MTANPLRFQASIVRKKRRFALELFDGHVARCHSRCVFRSLLLSSRGCLFYRLTHTGRTAFISKFRVAAGLDYEALLQSFVTTGRESCFLDFFQHGLIDPLKMVHVFSVTIFATMEKIRCLDVKI